MGSRWEEAGEQIMQVLIAYYKVLVDYCKDFGFYSEGDGNLWRIRSRDVT